MTANIDTSSSAVNLTGLADKIRAAHQAVGFALQNGLDHALAAGDALIAAQKLVKHGEWQHWLKRHCGDLSDRTARLYMRAASHRFEIEANRQRVADLSLRGALKLIAGESKSDEPASRKKPTKPATGLSTLAWSNATDEHRRHFLDGIGLVSLLKAIPPNWHAEIERRVEGLHKVKTRKLSDSIVKALRQALSLQKVHKDKEGMAPGVATALNTINDLLLKEGADLNEISGITIDESLTKARAKRAA